MLSPHPKVGLLRLDWCDSDMLPFETLEQHFSVLSSEIMVMLQMFPLPTKLDTNYRFEGTNNIKIPPQKRGFLVVAPLRMYCIHCRMMYCMCRGVWKTIY